MLQERDAPVVAQIALGVMMVVLLLMLIMVIVWLNKTTDKEESWKLLSVSDGSAEEHVVNVNMLRPWDPKILETLMLFWVMLNIMVILFLCDQNEEVGYLE
jgi:hypothetical protein